MSLFDEWEKAHDPKRFEHAWAAPATEMPTERTSARITALRAENERLEKDNKELRVAIKQAAQALTFVVNLGIIYGALKVRKMRRELKKGR